MVNPAQELAALRQKHEFTVIELTDLKEDYEKLKKLNTSIIESLAKNNPSDVFIFIILESP